MKHTSDSRRSTTVVGMLEEADTLTKTESVVNSGFVGVSENHIEHIENESADSGIVKTVCGVKSEKSPQEFAGYLATPCDDGAEPVLHRLVRLQVREEVPTGTISRVLDGLSPGRDIDFLAVVDSNSRTALGVAREEARNCGKDPSIDDAVTALQAAQDRQAIQILKAGGESYCAGPAVSKSQRPEELASPVVSENKDAKSQLGHPVLRLASTPPPSSRA